MIYNKHTKTLVVLVCVALGFMISMQMKTTKRQKTIPVQRAEDLSERLKAAEKDKERLSVELDKLKSQGGSAALQKEVERLKTLAGETALQGKGIELTLDDSQLAAKAGENKNLYIIHDEDLLRVVNELRAAGAEAISLNGQRLIASSEVRCTGPTVVVNETRLAAPFIISAIGNPQTLESALKIRGGVLDNFKFWGIKAEVRQSDTIKIPAVKKGHNFEYAKVAAVEAAGQEEHGSGQEGQKKMIYAIVGLAIGVLLGLFAPGYIPKEYAALFSVALMAGLDTAFGGLRAGMEGVYDNTIFLSGFLVNIVVAVFFCYIGVLLSIDFYMVVILVLGMRIFQNISIIRRLYLKK